MPVFERLIQDYQTVSQLETLTKNFSTLVKNPTILGQTLICKNMYLKFEEKFCLISIMLAGSMPGKG